MANRSYLCGTNARTLYPSFVDRNYDSAEQTLANDVWCVPLMWMSLFRVGEIETKTFETDGGPVRVESPITSRKQALVNLRDAMPFFNDLFEREGSLTEYGRFLFRAIKASPYTYVTIEMEEIASAAGEKKFYKMFRQALSSIDGEPSAAIKKVFIEIAGFKKLKQFPPAELQLNHQLLKQYSDNDHWNHCRVCGAGVSISGLGRPVPWEL